MSTAAQLPATGDGLSDALAQAHSALDRVLTEAATAATQPRSRSAKQWREALQEAERLHRRTDSARLRIIAAAEDQQAPATAGFADTSSWITRQTHTGHRQAASDASLAATLGVTDLAAVAGDGAGIDGGPGTDGSLLGINGDGTDSTHGVGGAGGAAGTGSAGPAGAGAVVRSVTGRALDEGSISVAHAKVIHATLRDLPTNLSTADRDTCEVELVALAKTRTPAALRKAARRVLDQVITDAAVVDAHENATVEAEEDRAWDHAAFWVKDNHDGTMTGHFTVPWHAGATLKKIIDAMTAPRRRTGAMTPTGAGAAFGLRRGSSSATNTGTGTGTGAGAGGSDEAGRNGGTIMNSGAGSGTGTGTGTDSGVGGLGGSGQIDWKSGELDWQHRRGLAFAELLGHLPTDHLHDKVAATLLITTDLNTLRADTDRAGITDMGEPLSAGQVRRAACSAGLIPTVLGGDSLPLDLGRQRRCHTTTQKLALAPLYDTCAADGCTRPFAWTELHHLTPWAQGGTTDLNHAVPLCGEHHRWIDRTDTTHTTSRNHRGAHIIHFHRQPQG